VAAAPIVAADVPPADVPPVDVPAVAPPVEVPLVAVPPVPVAPSDAPPAAPAATAAPADEPTGSATTSGDPAARAAAMWKESIVPALKPFARALFAVAAVSAVRDGSLVLALPNDTHRRKCADQLTEVESTIATVVGARVPVTLIVDGSAGHDEHDHRDEPSAASARTDRPSSRPDMAPVVELHPGGVPTPDEDIDLDDLVDAPPDSVITPIERLAQAFPGSELLDERR
jgi:DNA polymerase III subunit gamma/tau